MMFCFFLAEQLAVFSWYLDSTDYMDTIWGKAVHKLSPKQFAYIRQAYGWR
jgi:hypothetical protein